MSTSDVAISVRGLSKAYTISHGGLKRPSFREAVVEKIRHPFRKPKTETFWALNDVSFDIKKGDVVGIIGRNGAGKSTLLKVLSRIVEPTKGEVDMFGRVGSLLEVGTGFHPELTGRENVYLNGAILGMRREEIKKQFDAIVDFAEVERFLDTPVKRYSSGMYVRLAFAVAAHLNPEILIVDEVLAVGDAQFQKKCLGKMKEVAAGGARTVLFVSHNRAAVENLCSKAVLMRAGTVFAQGPTPEIMDAYWRDGQLVAAKDLMNRRDREGDGEVRVMALRILDEKGQEVLQIAPNSGFVIELQYISNISGNTVSASIDIETTDGIRLATLFSAYRNQHFQIQKGQGLLKCHISGLNLRPDRYSLNVFLGSAASQHDFIRSAAQLEVRQVDVYKSGRIPERSHGPLLVDFNWA